MKSDYLVDWSKDVDKQPDWDNSPIWAKWYAVDGNGEAWWFGSKPQLFENYIWYAKGLSRIIGYVDPSNYRESLQQRVK